MVRLTKVELRRLFARRLTVVGLAGLFLITVMLLAATWFEARPLSAEEQQRAQQQFETAHRQWVEETPELRQQCAADWRAQPDPKPSLEQMCTFHEPKLEDFGKPRSVFAELAPELLQATAYFLAFAAFLIGASFLAAEFSSGAIGNWLTFEPRRLRVYGSKLLAAALGFVPVAAATLGILTVGAFLIVSRLGDTASTTGKVWGNLAELGGRAVVMTAAAAVLGSVIGLLFRHTAAALGVVMGYLVLVEGVFAAFLQEAQPWLVRLNVDAFLRHGTQYYVTECKTGPDGTICDQVERTVSFSHGSWYLAAVTTALVVLAAWTFHRRDVN
jgi:ABC-2 type transport system permease protein